jgi:hypothetical protein
MQFRVGSDKDFLLAIHLALFSYRCLPHEGLGESPAFALFGSDLRPARTKDWRAIPHPNEADRLKFLLSMREEIVKRATLRAARLEAKFAQERSPKQFQLGDLVLVRQPPKDKLSSQWSLPYRVVAVDNKGTTATLRHLLFDDLKPGVHVSNCRFIGEPTSMEQRAEWDRVVRTEILDAGPNMRKRVAGGDWIGPEKSRGLAVRGETDAPRRRTASPAVLVDNSEGAAEGHVATS